MAKKKWIKAATENKSALHRNLGVPEGERIPDGKLREAANSKNSKIRKEASLAMTLKGMKHEKKEEKKAPTPSSMMKKMYESKGKK